MARGSKVISFFVLSFLVLGAQSAPSKQSPGIPDQVACSCPQIHCLLLPRFNDAYDNFDAANGAVFRGKVLRQVLRGCQTLYLVRVTRTFKGCPVDQSVFVSAPCYATSLEVGSKNIFLAGQTKTKFRGNPVYNLGGCSPVYPLERSLVRYANLRREFQVCPAKGTCLNGSPFVYCFVWPCDPRFATCSSHPNATCDVRCGSCAPTFFDETGNIIRNCSAPLE
mmetsp:Transcript_9082/g.18383  ORF Transcript_9082/g.18383 Transcript_9082/m.18383 type:complete len:223 (+) Transcript_9082:360-1028(+)